jgi:hypothetical protein
MKTNIYTYEITTSDGTVIQLQFLADSDEAALEQLTQQLKLLGLEVEARMVA